MVFSARACLPRHRTRPTGRQGNMADRKKGKEGPVPAGQGQEQAPASAEEPITEPAHLEEQLEEGPAPAEQGGQPLGIEEALRAWEEGGYRVDDLEEEQVLPVKFAQLEPDGSPVSAPEPDRLHNVQVEVAVELGRKEMSVRELMALKEQSVIELDKLAGEPFTIWVNQRRFAEGEIVVVAESLGVRITHVFDDLGDIEEEEY